MGISTTEVYTDLNSLQNLKQSAVKDAQAALPEAARQFEAVMITMMMKSMRETGMEDPLFSSEAEKSYRDMYDQQLGLELSKGRGIGVAESIVRQMQQGSQSPLQEKTSREEAAVLKMPGRRFFQDHYSHKPLQENVPVHKLKEDKKLTGSFESPEDFVKKLWPMAEKAADKLGVNADVIISQAALETGWGKHIIRAGENSSFNLFNIKAGRGWDGDQMEKSSIEFIEGKAIQKKSDFRSYDSLEQSFADYVHFIKDNPRYSAVFNKKDKQDNTEQLLHDQQGVQSSENYIEILQKAGYATDPAYSDKILQLLNSDVIQNQVKYQSKNPIKMASK
ncbi:MAG: flagellar assembly peptidoglycan hydrolase FlgJ [gamma proteobacterium symbiont of Taylorina sp.]|nr:flagellar assembly peptidoglycan hydrolase FlgJ [gamma proteobacterium symbiont of Taylorina sp.]